MPTDYQQLLVWQIPECDKMYVHLNFIRGYTMVKSGVFKSLGYNLFAQPGLIKLSYQNAKLKEMAKVVPASVFFYWSDTAKNDFPGIKTTTENFAVACSALLQFFHLSAIEKMPLMLPSKAADSIWHTWLAHDKDGLTAFLKTYLNQDIGHVEKNVMGQTGSGGPVEPMANTWRAAHDYENNVQFHGKLPNIFEADKITGIPGGFWYDRDADDRRQGCFYNMDAKGVPGSEKLGVEMLSWPSIYNGMTLDRQNRADNEIITPYKEPPDVLKKHAAVLASLGFAAGIAGLTAATHLENMAAEEARKLAAGDAGINPVLLAAQVGFNVGGGSGDNGGYWGDGGASDGGI